MQKSSKLELLIDIRKILEEHRIKIVNKDFNKLKYTIQIQICDVSNTG